MPSQNIAQNYWLSLLAQPMLAYLALSDIVNIVQRYGPDELDEANAAIQQYYADDGLTVDLDTLNEARDTLKSSNLAFWAGAYHMPHSDAGTLRLSVGGDFVTLTPTDVLKGAYFSVPSESVSFKDQTLSYEDDKVRFNAKLWFPSDLPENAAVAADDMGTRNEARLTGTLSVMGDKPEGPYTLSGKRGVYTAAGFNDPGYGDPAPVWTGQYQTQYVDDDFSLLGTIALSVNADGSMALALGDLQASAVAFANNTLAAKLPTGAVIALRLLCTSNGVRSFTGAVKVSGITRRLVGTCPVLYAEAAARSLSLRAASDGTPGFCDTNIDQALTLAQLGAPVEPLKSLSPVPVVFADGSPGSIVITPTRATDVYRVPPGAMVAYRPPATAQSDKGLQVAWRLDKGYTLLRMIEGAYYQLRVTLSDAQSADHKGIDISMALDEPSAPGFLSLLAPSASTCGPDTGGAHSPVKDFTIASVLLANARTLDHDGVLAYQFALAGKSTSLDNAAGDHDGFLCATLNFNAADGSQKYPPRLVRIPLLCAVSLPVTLAPPLAIEGMAALPVAYPNRPSQAMLSATGGVKPIVWTSTSSPPDGLAWAPSNDGASFTLSGKLGAVPAGQPIPVSVSAQSDPRTVVSRIKTGHGALPVSNPPEQPTTYASIGWIAGALIFCGGTMALNARIKWGQIDREFREAYAEQMRLLSTGHIPDFSVIFDNRAVELAGELRNAIRQRARADLGPNLTAIEVRLNEFNMQADWFEMLRAAHRRALTDGHANLAENLRIQMEVSNAEMERVRLELRDLRNAAVVDNRALEHD